MTYYGANNPRNAINPTQEYQMPLNKLTEETPNYQQIS